ncbi:hypothetical protein GOV03_03695 [Candidatus Woesearchaeota archaeon]|nr:hypothetical protein [Candidatus Woesearchaeota archaeon]
MKNLEKRVEQRKQEAVRGRKTKKSLQTKKKQLKKEKKLLIGKFIDKLLKLDGSQWESDLALLYDYRNNLVGYHTYTAVWGKYKIELNLSKLPGASFEQGFYGQPSADLKPDAVKIAKKAEYTLVIEDIDEDIVVVESSGVKIRNLCDIIHQKVQKSLLKKEKEDRRLREYNKRLEELDYEIGGLNSEIGILKEVL